MKNLASTLTLLLLLAAAYWSFKASMPGYAPDRDAPLHTFSTDRALVDVKELSKAPHAVGFPAHEQARAHIVSELEKMGLEPVLQEGYTAGDWGNYSKAVNILARIKGTRPGKALLLLSHYDSSPHSSLGASDAGSGVATVLEGVRAFLSTNKAPKNDIIVLLSDAEELGLNGADLFVNKNPWAQEVGLVLNFEARGSGGPSYMLLETNRGNRKLIEAFTEAGPEYPVANSLAYSIYKMLPNDTDLTVFREDADIEGFNFAFIDDHFDYHTARDDYERLDRNTLAHQGSYLMPLLHYFADADLTNLKTLNELVYFNVPLFKLVSYPFDWIWPMFALAVVFFIGLLVRGFLKKRLSVREILKGFLPLLITLAVNALIGYLAWPALKGLYPQYQDILHGFPYNGYTYIAAFVTVSIAVCFWAYGLFKDISTPNLLVGPILLWLCICGGIAVYLQGASFFIVPIFALLVSFLILLDQKDPNPYLLVLLALPAIWIHAPLIKMLPVGLGLKLIIGTTLLATALFFLLLPLFGAYRNKKQLAYVGLVLFLGMMASAHFGSGFSVDRPKPSSLLYVLDADAHSAQWATYEHEISDWTAHFIGKDKKIPENLSDNTLSSKYGTGFTYVSEAPLQKIDPPQIEKLRDTVIGDDRLLEICITPLRKVNRLEVFTNQIPVLEAAVNGIPLSAHYLENRKQGKLVTHYISDNEYTELQLTLPKDSALELTLYEASNDLVGHPLFGVPARPDDVIPMPFVLNDAVLVKKTVRF